MVLAGSGPETFSVVLEDPRGATMANPNRAVVTILDDDSAPPTTNPLEQAQFFVQQRYADFLSRQPDAAGQSYWANQLNSCGADAACLRARRIGVSAAFYFKLVLTPEIFVNRLFDNAGLVGFAAERQVEIDAIRQQGRSRAQVLRNVIEIEAFRSREYNSAFVLMQYFGYLRRDPDQGGYDFWLNILNRQPQNARGMVCAFITSEEMQVRFSTVAPRTNGECAGAP
jgi:hypothetical protein